MLAALISHGVHGRIRAAWPPYWSEPAWGAMVTGFPQKDILGGFTGI